MIPHAPFDDPEDYTREVPRAEMLARHEAEVPADTGARLRAQHAHADGQAPHVVLGAIATGGLYVLLGVALFVAGCQVGMRAERERHAPPAEVGHALDR